MNHCETLDVVTAVRLRFLALPQAIDGVLQPRGVIDGGGGLHRYG